MPKFYVTVEWRVPLQGYIVIESTDKEAARKDAIDCVLGSPDEFPGGGPIIAWPRGWSGTESYSGCKEWHDLPNGRPVVKEVEQVEFSEEGGVSPAGAMLSVVRDSE